MLSDLTNSLVYLDIMDPQPTSSGSEATSDFGAPNSSIFDSLQSSGSIHTRTNTRPRTSAVWDYTAFNHRNDIVYNKNNRVI